MGSGLVLLGIVGAWLAVLVPMALRKHDTHLRSADRFQDAMRVLSRRSGAADGAAAVDPEPEEVPAGRIAVLRQRLVMRAADRAAARTPLTPAARRRRLLLGLLLLAVATLVGTVVGPLWLLAPHLVADLLVGAFLVHLRRTAAARAEREWRAAPQRRRRPAPVPVPVVEVVPEPVLRVPAHVAGIPDRMPARVPAAVPAARYDEVRGAQGEAWSPVPVPTPTYLSAPTAPRRVVDLTTPGAYSDGLAEAERDLGIVDEGPELDEILERRRAVND